MIWTASKRRPNGHRLAPLGAVALLGCASASPLSLGVAPTALPSCGATTVCLAGVVIDNSTHAPIDGAQFVVSGTGCSDITHAQGDFAFECASAVGQHDIALVRIGYKRAHLTLEMTAGRRYWLQGRMRRDTVRFTGF
jgi:hypothetical protein